MSGTNWVYIRVVEPGEWAFVVGHYSPDGEWHPESDHPTTQSAARRCAWLNGGGGPEPEVDPFSEHRDEREEEPEEDFVILQTEAFPSLSEHEIEVHSALKGMSMMERSLTLADWGDLD
ncbi:MAG: hypothetical protein ABSD38_20935 [Syntrophorhabdales bacterium]|jgi:hypothetical protein